MESADQLLGSFQFSALAANKSGCLIAGGLDKGFFCNGGHYWTEVFISAAVGSSA